MLLVTGKIKMLRKKFTLKLKGDFSLFLEIVFF